MIATIIFWFALYTPPNDFRTIIPSGSLTTFAKQLHGKFRSLGYGSSYDQTPTHKPLKYVVLSREDNGLDFHIPAGKTLYIEVEMKK